MTTKRIHLIATPRNVSTALMYSFAQRSDTTVVDEPLYASFLKLTDTDHPGKAETLAAQENDCFKVLEEMKTGDYNREVVFFKGMAHHVEGFDWAELLDFTNFFLVRNPKQLIASFAKVVPQPTMEMIGLKRSYELYQYLVDQGVQPVVMDSGVMLQNPPLILSKVCSQLGIPFEESMLKWQAGARPEDGVWAKYWYANVHQSTGFKVQKTSHRPLPDYLIPLYEECMPYYEAMTEFSVSI